MGEVDNMVRSASLADSRPRMLRMPVIKTGPEDFSVGDVLRMTGVSDTTLSRYVRRAGVQTPRQGKKNHRYTEDEVKAILGEIAANIRCRQTRDRCCGLLANCQACPISRRSAGDLNCRS
jgi:MerR HTH family regulatory protein